MYIMKKKKDSNIKLKQIEMFLDNIIESKEIDDAIQWLVNLGTMTLTGDEILDLYSKDMETYTFLLVEQIREENYEICGKIRDVITITTEDVIKLIKNRTDIERDEKADMLVEVEFIKIAYEKALFSILEEEV